MAQEYGISKNSNGDTPVPAILPPPNIPIKPEGNGDDGDNSGDSEEDGIEF